MTREEMLVYWKERKPVECCGKVVKDKDNGAYFFRQCNECGKVTDVFKYELFLEDEV